MKELITNYYVVKWPPRTCIHIQCAIKLFSHLVPFFSFNFLISSSCFSCLWCLLISSSCIIFMCHLLFSINFLVCSSCLLVASWFIFSSCLVLRFHNLRNEAKKIDFTKSRSKISQEKLKYETIEIG